MRRRAGHGFRLAALLVVCLAMAAAPAVRGVTALERFEFREVHMGLAVRIVLYAMDRRTAEGAARAAFARIADLDATLSDYRPDSELTSLSATSGAWVTTGRDLFAVLARALEIARLSDGAFDPTVGPLTQLWREARRTGTPPSEVDVARARASVGWRHVELDAAHRRIRLARPRMRLDLGGIAKGFILQEALVVLDTRGHRSALLEAGGDVVVGDAPPGRAGWRIDAPYAEDSVFVARAAALTRAALATSGPVAQFFEVDGARHSHVLDPRSGTSLTASRVVGVIAPDGATADALATALGVLGAGLKSPWLPRGVLDSIGRSGDVGRRP
jgi:thiamine biosynthesis lipoprotein